MYVKKGYQLYIHIHYHYRHILGISGEVRNENVE